MFRAGGVNEARRWEETAEHLVEQLEASGSSLAEERKCLNCDRQKSAHYLDEYDDPVLCYTEGEERFRGHYTPAPAKRDELREAAKALLNLRDTARSFDEYALHVEDAFDRLRRALAQEESQ
jgi:hypothetical protein